MTDETTFLTTKELAAMLHVPEATVRYWRFAERGPRGFKIPGGRRVLYKRADVEQWLSEAQAAS